MRWASPFSNEVKAKRDPFLSIDWGFLSLVIILARAEQRMASKLMIGKHTIFNHAFLNGFFVPDGIMSHDGFIDD